jgi:hypothetical protein
MNYREMQKFGGSYNISFQDEQLKNDLDELQQHEKQDVTKMSRISPLKIKNLLTDCYFSDFGFFIMA